MRFSPGDTVANKYRIVRLIGDGGMGTVYEARHEVLGAPVALKFLHSDLAKRSGLSARFLQEARVSASIQSVHVAHVTDVDTLPDGSPYLVMEYLQGETLQSLLDRQPVLSVDHAIDFALQTLSGLEAAHAIGVVHRDLKPDNIFITPSAGGPVIKLIDFGIAKLKASSEFTRGLTRAGVMMGTPEYMAPEQLFAADQVDARADLYSMGVILYEMLSGQRPADGDDAQIIVAKVGNGEVLNLHQREPSVPGGLSEVVHRTMSPDRNARYASAMDLRLALAPFAGQLSHAGRLAATPAPATSTPPPPVTHPSRAPASQRASEKPHPVTERSFVHSAASLRDGAAPSTPDPIAAEPIGPGGTAYLEASHQPMPGGSTQDVSPAVIHRHIAEHTQNPVAPPAGPAYPSGPSYLTGPSGITRPAQRRSRGPLAAILALVLGALVTGSIVLAIALSKRSSNDESTTLPSFDSSPAPATTISAQTPQDPQEPQHPSGPTTQAPGPLPTTRPPTTPGSSPSTKPKDAGASGIPPFSFPSSLPPLPSNLPPLPTQFPTELPSIPGLPPGLLPGNTPDAG